MDISAFTEHIREHQAGLRSFIRSLGAEADWVDDIAQETFVVAWQRMDTFEQDRDFGKWVRGIARNILRNESRKQSRRRRILSEKLTDLLSQGDDSADREEPWASPGLVQALRDCVGELPDRARSILSHRYGKDMNAAELASRFGVRHDAMRQFLVRVRQQLKGCVERKMGGSLA